MLQPCRNCPAQILQKHPGDMWSTEDDGVLCMPTPQNASPMYHLPISMPDLRICWHCGRIQSGYATVLHDDVSVPVCHPSATGKPDCYQRISACGEYLGALIPVMNPDLPPGTAFIRRREDA
jgi:hypothetical protein